MVPESFERPEPQQDETELAAKIAALRPALRAYVLSILPHSGACDDIVQETLVFLWERRAEHREDSNLKAWAFKVAWFKAMGYRRDRMREERIIRFSEDSLHEIAGEMETLLEDTDGRMQALRHCLSGLTTEEIALLRLKYVEDGSLTGYALSRRENPNRVQKVISRLRLRLRHCIESKLSRR